MRKLILFVECLFIAWSVCAQNGSLSVSGKVIDKETNEPLFSANVLLFQEKDSVSIQQTITNNNGAYSFHNLPAGSYFIRYSFIGYTEKTGELFQLTTSSIQLSDIQLEENSVLLDMFQVVGQKKFVEQQADKMVINPEASITTSSDNVLDVLSKSPGVLIDKDGNVSLKGKSGITILIDDKPTYLSGTQLSEMLRNLQASSVERIEIMENPPAKYDAEGSSGIINIKTKRGKIKGWNGSLTLGASMGEKFRGNDGLDMNYRNEKWNIYGNYYGGVYNQWNNTDIVRKFPEGDNSTLYENTKNPGRSYYNGLKFGLDYYLTERQVIGVMGKFSHNDWTGDIYNTTDIYDATNIQQSHEDTYSLEDEGSTDWSVNFNYKWDIDTTGRMLSADFDFAQYDYHLNVDMNTTYIPVSDPQMSINNQSSMTRLYAFKIDYEHPLSERAKLDAGLKSSLATIDSEQDYKAYDGATGTWHDSGNMSNQFKYKENVNALYVSWKQQWTKKLDMQLGLRAEQTNSQGDNITIDSVTNRNYIDIFPTLFLQHQFSEKHQLGLSYAYRIGRPTYWAQNPIIWTASPYTSYGGNALLLPQYTNSVKLSYTFNQQYILSVEYAHTNDGYSQVFVQEDDSKKTLVTWANISKTNYLNATLVIPVTIGKWCRINTNMTSVYRDMNTLYEGYESNESNFAFFGNINTAFTLPAQWSLELSGWYRTKIVNGLIEFNPMGTMDFGVQKKLLKDKLTLKLSIKDILNSTFKYSINYQNIDSRGTQKWDGRRIGLNLTWRFGKDNIKPARQRSTGLEEEASRTGK